MYRSKDSVSGCGETLIAAKFTKRYVYINTPVEKYYFTIIKRNKEAWLGIYDDRKYIIRPGLVDGKNALLFLSADETLILSDENICGIR